MISMQNLIEKAEHAFFLLEMVFRAIPGKRGEALRKGLSDMRAAFNHAGVKQAVEEVRAKASAEAQTAAEELWREEPTKA